MDFANETQDLRSNIALCPWQLLRALPLGTTSDKGLYFTVDPLSLLYTDTVYTVQFSTVQYSTVQYNTVHYTPCLTIFFHFKPFHCSECRGNVEQNSMKSL